MWQTVPLVSSGITLAAFVVAIAAWIFRQQAIRKERLILTAAEADRGKLVTEALEFFSINPANLPPDQQYKIAIEQIRARAHRFLITAVVVVITAILTTGVVVFAIKNPGRFDDRKLTNSEAAVVIMDSPLRDVVYDQESWKKGRTNADEISEILDDLPGLVLYKETTNLKWEREDEVIRMRPKLIVMHASCFYDTTNLEDSDRKFFSFLQYFAHTDVHFLVYSRGFHHGSESWKATLIRQIPELNSRIHVLEVPSPGTFSDPVVRMQLKTTVKEVLSL